MKSNILPKFQSFLRDRNLVPAKNIPFYAHWASKFLSFSNKNEDLKLEEILIKYGRGTRNAVAVAMEIAQRKGLNGLFDFFNNCIGTIFGKEKNRQPILCCH